MNEQADRIEAKLGDVFISLHDLIRDHNRIQATEGSICTALSELRKRDPADSPNPRRLSDPDGTDFRAGYRGKP
jgi:hypothetical protein